MNAKLLYIATGCSCALILCGCGTSLPEVVPATGIVTINGDPLPNATVRFVPMQDGLDGAHTAAGVSDSDGRFRLVSSLGDGAYACLNKVTIQEGPAPAEARAMSDEGARLWGEYKASLLNRPIPREYMSVGQTPLTFQVTPDKNEYLIKIER